MASLSGNKSTGGPNWDYYVVKCQKLDVEIEHGCSAVFHEKIGTALVPTSLILPEKTKIKIVSMNLVIQGHSKFALCQYDYIQGYICLGKIRKPSRAGLTGILLDETRAITTLNGLIKECYRPITIDVFDAKGDVFVTARRCIGAYKVPGTPKADLVIVSEIDEPIYISHKAEGGPTAFRLYSGISHIAGETIHNHTEVKSFLEKITNYIGPEGLETPCVCEIKDPDLVGYSVFGPNYKKEFGVNNVHMIAQGHPMLERIGDSRYGLKWTDSCVINGDVAELCSSDYCPVLGATFASNRGFEFEGKRYLGTRASVYPIATLKGRKGLIVI